MVIPQYVTFDVTLVAVAFTVFFFVSPLEAALKIHKAGDAGDFSATPCIIAAACSITQVYYALVCILRENDGSALWLNFGVNLFGFVTQEALLGFHYVYNKKRAQVFMHNLVMLGLSGGFFLLLEFGLRNVAPGLQWWKAQPTYLNVCSIVAVIINIGMYAGPLVVMGTVVRTKSVKFMPLTPSIFVICASSCWMSEGLMLGDVTFWLPNLIGLMLGAFQIGLYVMFCKNDKVNPTEVAGQLIDHGGAHDSRGVSLTH